MISFINEYYCSQFTPIHEEVFRNVPFEMREENRFSVQIGLMPSSNRESLSWGWQLSWPLANTNPSVAFHSHLESSPGRLQVEAAAADTGESPLWPSTHAHRSLSDFNSAYVLCRRLEGR